MQKLINPIKYNLVPLDEGENIEGLFNGGSITFGDNTEILKQMQSEQER